MWTRKRRGAFSGRATLTQVGLLLTGCGLACCGCSDDGGHSPDDLADEADAQVMMEIEPIGDPLCEALEPALDVGEPCVTSGPCGDSGLCFTEGPVQETCHQVCLPDRCDDLCPEGTQCVDVSEEARRLRLTVRALPLDLDAPIGVCEPIPVPLPLYGTCGPGLPGFCPEGSDCVYFNPGEEAGYCSPTCEGSNVPCEDGIGTCGVNAYGGPRRARDRYCAVDCPDQLDESCPEDLKCRVISGFWFCGP